MTHLAWSLYPLASWLSSASGRHWHQVPLPCLASRGLGRVCTPPLGDPLPQSRGVPTPSPLLCSGFPLLLESERSRPTYWLL